MHHSGWTGIQGLIPDDTADWDFEWTALGQLAEANHGTEADRDHTYDAFGRRVETTDGTDTWEYLYHGWHMIGESDGTDWLWMEVSAAYGEAMYEHVALDTIDWDNDTLTTDYVGYVPHTDFQETVWGVSDEDGALVERYVQDDPYGVTHTLDSSSTNIGDYASEVYHRKRLHGGVVDATVEIYDFRNRWLRPAEGTWMSRDPLGQVDSWNLMQPLVQRPLSMTDRFGTRTLPIMLLWAMGCYIDGGANDCPPEKRKKAWEADKGLEERGRKLAGNSSTSHAGEVLLMMATAPIQINCECETCPVSDDGEGLGSTNTGAIRDANGVVVALGQPVTTIYYQRHERSQGARSGDLCCPCSDDWEQTLIHELLHTWCITYQYIHGGSGKCGSTPGTHNASYEYAADTVSRCMNEGGTACEAAQGALDVVLRVP